MNVVKYSSYAEICSEATGVEGSVSFVIFGVHEEANGRIARELTTSSLLGNIGVYNLGVLNSELQLQKSLENYDLQSELWAEGHRLLITATGEAIVYSTNKYRLVSKLKKAGAQKVIGVFVNTKSNNNDYRISIEYGINTVDSPLAKIIWRDPPSKEREEWDALYRVELITYL
ncbi:hypothetical protein IKF04_03210 [Candidatus Saccharibacteria bacterium]|nr:hypothetical protein [Candidatus Saccharibacteria bacterium]